MQMITLRNNDDFPKGFLNIFMYNANRIFVFIILFIYLLTFHFTHAFAREFNSLVDLSF